MSWIVELFVQFLWEGSAEAASRKWGWTGLLVVLLVPAVAVGLLLLWIFYR